MDEYYFFFLYISFQSLQLSNLVKLNNSGKLQVEFLEKLEEKKYRQERSESELENQK
jgi:hypothetical protein